MRNISGKKRSITSALLVVLLLFLGLVSCTSSLNGPSSSNTQNTVIDWVNFIRFGGITYLAAPTRSGRSYTTSDLGPVFATVTFKLAGHVQHPEYQSRDGDAAFLDAGTKLYTVKGYNPTFRLAAQQNNTFILYEADTNPRAKKGADLLDIGGKVQFIGRVSEQDGVTELGAIKDPERVTALVNMVLEATVDQNRQGGNRRSFIAFHLVDGTVVTRAYWLDTNELARGILLPKAFGIAIEATVPK